MKKLKTAKELDYWEFLNIGLACYGLCLLEEAGILSKLLEKEGSINEKDLQHEANPPLLRAALVTLVGAKVMEWKEDIFSLTNLGHNLAENIGTFQIPFVGYRHLLAKQDKLLKKPQHWKDSEIDYQSVAVSSINFGDRYVDPILIELVKRINPKGTICDFGCGTAEKLVKLCEATRASGLGFEKDKKVVKESWRFIKNHPEIEVVQSDITKLCGVWEDVELGFIGMVLHDLHKEKECVSFLSSLKNHFPRMRCLIIFDIVTMSQEVPSIMPGFDYVHGLQGIQPRTYQENLAVFEKADYQVRKEVAIPHMPNAYIWVLEGKS